MAWFVLLCHTSIYDNLLLEYPNSDYSAEQELYSNVSRISAVFNPYLDKLKWSVF